MTNFDPKAENQTLRDLAQMGVDHLRSFTPAEGRPYQPAEIEQKLNAEVQS